MQLFVFLMYFNIVIWTPFKILKYWLGHMLALKHACLMLNCVKPWWINSTGFTSKTFYLHFEWYFNYYVCHWSPPDKLLLLSQEAFFAKNIYLHISLHSNWWVLEIFSISANDPGQGCVPDWLRSEDSISSVSLSLTWAEQSPLDCSN